MAIRIALGASGDQAGGLIVRQGMRLTVIGIAAGLIAALAGGRALSALLYGVRGTDVTIVGLTVILLSVIAYVASQLPARRASQVDAMAVLRSE